MSQESGTSAIQGDQPVGRNPWSWSWLAMTAALSLFALWGAAHVPFHPDESTQLFMSGDFEVLLKNPASLAWSPDQVDDLRSHYRLVDAPLTKYLLGLGRTIQGFAALPADWDWSLSWEQNQARGALPNPGLLLSGRLILTLLIPLDLLFIYWIGRRISGEITGLLAGLLFGLNALVLLHDRRAMAEAALTFGVIFSAWSFLDGNRRPWLAGIAAAIVANSKQTGVFLLPVGLVAVLIPLESDFLLNMGKRIGMLVWRVSQYILVFTVLTWVLNPVLWSRPFEAARAAWIERQEYSRRQVEDFKHLSPETALDSPVKHLAAVAANLFFVPPRFAETANYQDQIRESETQYLSIPGHNLLRGIVVGSLLLVFTLAGVTLGVFRLFRAQKVRKKALAILLLISIFMGIGVYAVIPLPWQRYVIPLVPLICLWAAYGISAPLEKMR